MKLRALYLATIVVTSVLFGTIGFTGVAVAGNLQDGEIYWQGTSHTAANLAAGNQPVDLYNTDTASTTDTLTADENGNVTVNMSGLDGDYELRKQDGSPLLSFEVVVQTISANYGFVRVKDAGDLQYAVIDLNSNRASFKVELQSSTLNLSERIDGSTPTADGVQYQATGGGEIPINTSDGLGGTHTVTGEVVDTGATFSATVSPFDPPRFVYEAENTAPRVQLEENRTYWQAQVAAYDVPDDSATYQIRRSPSGGIGSLHTELTPNATGYVNVDTGDLDGSYTLIEEGQSTQLVNFSVQVQTLNTSLSSTDLVPGQTTILTVTSNRDGFDAYLWTLNMTSAELNQSVAGTERRGDDVVLLGINNGSTYTVNTSGLSDGTYKLNLRVVDSTAQVDPPFDVRSPSSSSVIVSDGDDDDSTTTPAPATSTPGTTTPTATPGGGQATATATPTETPTPTPTAMPSPTSTQTSSDGQPGLGVPTAIAALLVLFLAGRRRTD